LELLLLVPSAFILSFINEKSFTLQKEEKKKKEKNLLVKGRFKGWLLFHYCIIY